MEITVSQFNDRLTQVIEDLPRISIAILTDEKLKISSGLVSDIANRVQEKQILGDGSQRDYSKRPMLVGGKSSQKKSVFEGLMKEAKDDGEVHWVTIERGGQKYRLIVLPGGYDELRRREGHLNTKKNYSRTKEMWRGFGIKQVKETEVILGGRTDSSQDKINWNSSRDGIAIIAPTQEEEARAARLFIRALMKKIFDK